MVLRIERLERLVALLWAINRSTHDRELQGLLERLKVEVANG
jgi:hypothetical protein